MPESLYDEATTQIASFVHEFNQIQSSFRTELSHATQEISASLDPSPLRVVVDGG
jgi:hypothetical protein